MILHRNIVHVPETHNDGVFLVGDAPSSLHLRGYIEMSCVEVIKGAAQRHIERQYRELKE